MASHIGRCAWCGTIEEFLRFNRKTFMEMMKTQNAAVSDYPVGEAHYVAWRDEFKHLRVQLARLSPKYHKLHIALEYVLPGYPDKETGKVEYEKRPDAVIFSSNRVLVMEFKQHEPPPFEGFAREVRGYLRLLERWHPHVPKMSAKGLLVFADCAIPHPFPTTWLQSIQLSA